MRMSSELSFHRHFRQCVVLLNIIGASRGVYLGRDWTLTPPSEDRGAPMKFGQALCTTPDGTRFLVGANGYDNFMGAAYVYDLVRGDGSRPHHWRRTILTGSDSTRAESKKTGELRLVSRGSGFGFSCAMNDNGDVLAIGAPGHDLQKGKVYIFHRAQGSRDWVEVDEIQAPQGRNGDSFGWAICMNHDASVVSISSKGRRANNGEVFVFGRRPPNEVRFGLRARILPPDVTDEQGPEGIRIRNNFGVSLAMSRNGVTLAIGSTGYSREQGAVYVFSQSGDLSDWSMVQRLTAPTPHDFSFFGYKVAMDESGSTIIVGADGEDKYSGSVYVFTRIIRDRETLLNFAGHTFRLNKQEQCTVEPQQPVFNEGLQLQSPERKENDNFGGSVSISGDGRVIAVGCPGADESKMVDAGALYVYSKSNLNETDSTETSWVLAVRDISASPEQGSFFAWTTAVSRSGRRLLVSAPESRGLSGIVQVSSVVH